jgi:hypothetical protein
MPHFKGKVPSSASGQPLPALGGAHSPGVKTLRPISRRLCEVATEARSLPLSERLISSIAADVEPKHTGVIIKLLNSKGWFTEEVRSRCAMHALWWRAVDRLAENENPVKHAPTLSDVCSGAI